jgi:drug/metabolite transporter (DMT)-like permease
MACLVVAVYDGFQRDISPVLIALALSVPISYAVGNTYIKWKLDHMPPLVLAIYFLGIGGLLLLPLQFAPGTLSALNLSAPVEPHDWPLAIASIAFLSIVGTGLAILLFIQLVKHQGPLFAGMVTYVVPVLALVWGQYDNEKLTASQLTAIAGVLAMVALVQWGAAGSLRKTVHVMSE